MADPVTGLRSVAVDRCLDRHGTVDVVDVVAVPVGENAPDDPAYFARRAFAHATPAWVVALLAARQALVPLLGMRPSPADTLRVREVVDGEALITAAEPHLDFWCAVEVDPPGARPRLLRATTVVKLHGRRGAAYWAVVRHFHQPVTDAMLRRAALPASGAQSS